MKESIKRIVFVIILFVVIFGYYYIKEKDKFDLIFQEESNKYDINMDTKVVIGEEGQALINQKIEVEVFEEVQEIRFPIPIVAQTEEMKKDKKYSNNYSDINLIQAKCIDRKTKEQVKSYIRQSYSKSYIVISDIFSVNQLKSRNDIRTIKPGNKYEINLEYEFDKYAGIVHKYKKNTKIKLADFDRYPVNINNLEIKFPNEISRINVGKNEYEYIGDNTYNIKISNNKNNYIVLDNSVFLEISTIEKEDKFEQFGDNYYSYRYLEIIAIIVGMAGIIVFILTPKIKVPENYIERDPEEIIGPVFAESIVDGKIGAKELIMTTIVDLVIRKNLECIDDDRIKWKNSDGVKDYERKILKLVFYSEGSVINFDRINEMFYEDNISTNCFVRKFRNIKEEITKIMYESGVYNKTKRNILNICTIISILGLINLIALLLLAIPMKAYDDYVFYQILQINFIGIAICALGYFGYKKNNIKENNKRVYSSRDRKRASSFICFGIVLYLTITSEFKFFLIWLTIFILNVIILTRSRRHCYTAKGKVEYIKAYSFKRFIEDYSLLKDRKIEDHIIWDKYLAYAVAFGIPNQITNKIKENAMKANIILQKINEYL